MRRASRPTLRRAVVALFLMMMTGPGALRATPAEADAKGGDVLGTRPPAWHVEGWLNSKPLTLEGLKGKVVLVRWWTAPECPHCAATAPSLNAFHEEYQDRGLVVIGMYHHKSATPLDEKEVAAYAKKFGFRFPVAIDPGWGTLKKWWLNTGDRPWTSVSFLIDREGVIRHVHPGGRYEKGSEEYRVMKAKIEELIGEKG